MSEWRLRLLVLVPLACIWFVVMWLIWPLVAGLCRLVGKPAEDYWGFSTWLFEDLW